MKRIITKKTKIIVLIIMVLFIEVISLRKIMTNDGMKQASIYTIRYDVYSVNTGWHSWKKNGISSGKLKYPIESVRFNLKDKENFSYDIYTEDGKWIEDLKVDDNNKNKKNINAIKIHIYKNLYKKYNVCYRTYNEKNHWLGWACNGSISGNKNENIELIDVKIIPKNSSESEYLKNYNISDLSYMEF